MVLLPRTTARFCKGRFRTIIVLRTETILHALRWTTFFFPNRSLIFGSCSLNSTSIFRSGQLPRELGLGQPCDMPHGTICPRYLPAALRQHVLNNCCEKLAPYHVRQGGVPVPVCPLKWRKRHLPLKIARSRWHYCLHERNAFSLSATRDFVSTPS